ncbi:hypothetical protein Tco_0154471 [Tanacetum coccineum]
MAENTVRLWLKDHQDAMEKLAQQQAAIFQAQFDTLRAELQTRGLLQNWCGYGMVSVDDKEWFDHYLGQDYQRVFKKLMNRVTDIPDSLLISFYFSGLKLNLQRELLVSKPTTLGDAFSLARLTKARLEDKSAPTSVTVTKPISNVGNQRQSSPRLRELQRRRHQPSRSLSSGYL